MNLFLTRTDFLEDGIYGVLRDDNRQFVSVTLEHSYLDLVDVCYKPKVPAGIYACKRGLHSTHKITEPFETFEVLSVPGHQSILFHVGNFNDDSEGCILVGENRYPQYKMIVSSRKAFKSFMELQEGVDEFTLTVRDAGDKNT